MWKIVGSADEIGHHGRFRLGDGSVAVTKIFKQPRHVASKSAHRLQPLGVLGGLARRAPVDAVPILRGDDRHVQDGEILVKSVECGRRSATAADSDGSRRLVGD